MFHVKKINFVFPFQQYVANEPIIDDRVMLNGNKLFFLEPLEATAMGAYINASRYYYDYIIYDYLTIIDDHDVTHCH